MSDGKAAIKVNEVNDAAIKESDNADDRADMFRMGKTQEMRVCASNSRPFYLIELC
jgi:hypothetical protein